MSHGVWLFRSPAATRDTLVLLLAFTAGCVDAISYLGLGHVFTANMTGNTVLLGLSFGQAQWSAALRSLAALAGYLAGVAGGALLTRRTTGPALRPSRVTTICACELLLLVAVTLVGTLLSPLSMGSANDPMILFTAAAMGLQSVAATALGIRGVTTTYITGTWTAMMLGLIRRIPREREDGAEPPPGTGIQAAVVGVYFLAAVVGGVAEASWHLLALAVPSAAVGAVVGASWWWNICGGGEDTDST